MDIILPSSLRKLNQERCNRWHDKETDNWTLGDWSNAMMGEAGELANVVKKIRRHQSGASIAYNTPDMVSLRNQFAYEVADTLIYMDLLAYKARISPEVLMLGLKEKFNVVSEANGWDDMIWTPDA